MTRCLWIEDSFSQKKSEDLYLGSLKKNFSEERQEPRDKGAGLRMDFIRIAIMNS